MSSTTEGTVLSQTEEIRHVYVTTSTVPHNVLLCVGETSRPVGLLLLENHYVITTTLIGTKTGTHT